MSAAGFFGWNIDHSPSRRFVPENINWKTSQSLGSDSEEMDRAICGPLAHVLQNMRSWKLGNAKISQEPRSLSTLEIFEGRNKLSQVIICNRTTTIQDFWSLCSCRQMWSFARRCWALPQSQSLQIEQFCRLKRPIQYDQFPTNQWNRADSPSQENHSYCAVLI